MVAVTRPSASGGATRCRSVMVEMIPTVSRPSPTSCGMKRNRAATSGGPPASGMSSESIAPPTRVHTIVGPMPARRSIAGASAAAAREPTPPAEMTIPRSSGDSPRSSSAKSVYRAAKKFPKSAAVRYASAGARRSGSRQTMRSPSRISVQTVAASPRR